jgi:thiol-disulfide isomerase/thioredoxin
MNKPSIQNTVTRFGLLVMISAFLSACTNEGSYTIKGSALGFSDGTELILFELDQDSKSVPKDTLVVQNNLFSATYPYDEDMPLNYLQVEPGRNVVFFVENQDLSITLDKEDASNVQVAGGVVNTSYYDYLAATAGFAQQKEALQERIREANQYQDDLLARELNNEVKAIDELHQNYTLEFVSENSNSVFGLMLISELLDSEVINSVQATGYLDALSPKYQEHPMTADIRAQIKAKNANGIGAEALPFEAPTPEGGMLSLEQAMGKYTLIDFWASWCKPCRMENPNVVLAYNKYHERGLNIISVSLDRQGQKDRWLKAIEDDNMDWYHVSNLQFWQEPIARAYGVRSIPQTFLLDENGIVIAKNLRGQALVNTLESLMPAP